MSLLLEARAIMLILEDVHLSLTAMTGNWCGHDPI